MDFEWFKLQIVAKIDTFLHFLNPHAASEGILVFAKLRKKWKVVISANINLTIAVILSTNLSLYRDLNLCSK